MDLAHVYYEADTHAETCPFLAERGYYLHRRRFQSRFQVWTSVFSASPNEGS